MLRPHADELRGAVMLRALERFRGDAGAEAAPLARLGVGDLERAQDAAEARSATGSRRSRPET